MNSAKFNAMLKAARELLRLYHAGTETDPHVVRWAQELTAANPTEKRRPSPLRDTILAQFDGRDGLSREQIAAGITGKTERDIASALHDMSHREPRYLWMHRHKGHKCGRYYTSQAARDAAARDEHAALAAALELAERRRQQKIAKVEANRVARAEKRKAAKPAQSAKQPKKPEPIELAPARKAFNGAVATFKERPTLTAPKTTNARVNPDQGMPWAPKPKAETPSPTIDPNDERIQRGTPYTHDPRYQCAPNERPAGAGFAAEWARLRGAHA